MTVALSIVGALIVSLIGGYVGARLARRNAREDHKDKLLADALDDLVRAIAAVSADDKSAQREYAAAVARIAFHCSPELAETFRLFQAEPETETKDGQSRFVAAFQAAREELGRQPLDDETASVLLFGPRVYVTPEWQR